MIYMGALAQNAVRVNAGKRIRLEGNTIIYDGVASNTDAVAFNAVDESSNTTNYNDDFWFVNNNIYKRSGAGTVDAIRFATAATTSAATFRFYFNKNEGGGNFFDFQAVPSNCTLHVFCQDESASTSFTGVDAVVPVGLLSVRNDASGTSLGSVTDKIEIFDETGASIGFLPVYDSIT